MPHSAHVRTILIRSGSLIATEDEKPKFNKKPMGAHDTRTLSARLVPGRQNLLPSPCSTRGCVRGVISRAFEERLSGRFFVIFIKNRKRKKILRFPEQCFVLIRVSVGVAMRWTLVQLEETWVSPSYPPPPLRDLRFASHIEIPGTRPVCMHSPSRYYFSFAQLLHRSANNRPLATKPPCPLAPIRTSLWNTLFFIFFYLLFFSVLANIFRYFWKNYDELIFGEDSL